MPKDGFFEYILELLSTIEGITSRSMFGGYGLYKYNKIFAIIADNELYFKTGKSNIDYFLKAGLEPFEYEKNGKKVYMSYHKAPSEIYENQELLNQLVESSYQVSVDQKSSK